MRPALREIASLSAIRAVDVWIVGGTVRDVLLERSPRDLDIAVDRDALTFARQLADAVGGHYVELDEDRSVARVVLPHDDSAVPSQDDVGDAGVNAIAKLCGEAPPAARRRHDAIAYIDVAQLVGDVEKDMRRRDFTIDSLAVPLREAIGSPHPANVIDVCAGLGDLPARRVRMNSTSVFIEDPLRMLRAARIAAELGFEIEATTAAEISSNAPLVVDASPERQRDELARIFALDAAYPGARLLDALGLLDVLLPELAAGKGVEQPKEHAYDVFEHNLRTVEVLVVLLSEQRPDRADAFLWDGVWQAFGWCAAGFRAYFAQEMSEGRSRASLLKLAGLLHDVAKPQTRDLHDGRTRFFGHADVGARVAHGIMRRLRFSARETRFVSTLVAEHLRPVQLAQIGEIPTRRALYRFYNDLGDATPAVLFLSLADAAAARGPAMTPEAWAQQAAYMNSLVVRSLEDDAIVNPPRLLTGHDIMSLLGIEEGPLVGRLLATLREAQAAGEVTDAEAARRLVRQAARRESESAQISG